MTNGYFPLHSCVKSTRMAGNSFGQIFQITTFGESHGPGIGVVIDGCPSGVLLDISIINRDLQRRRPGQSAITTPRNEPDNFQILSGVIDNQTTGAPICLWIPNTNQKSADYVHIAKAYRPSHADYTYEKKYGIRDVRGGGRSSARETAARVAAGAIARQVLSAQGIDITALVASVGDIAITNINPEWKMEHVDSNIVRCPDREIAERMIARIEEVRDQGDTIGGTVACRIKNCPPGLGEPIYNKLHATLGSAILSINACKGFEIGSGFSGTQMLGSEHNDSFSSAQGQITTLSNHSGGVQGGISNGMDIVFRAAFKPVSTLMQTQDTVDQDGKSVRIEGKGRHDPCVVPRAVPIVEAMAAIVILDLLLMSRATGPLA